MSLNIAIAPSRRRKSWCEFSTRLLSHLPVTCRASLPITFIAARYDRNLSVTITLGWPYRFMAFFKNFNAALRLHLFVTKDTSASPSWLTARQVYKDAVENEQSDLTYPARVTMAKTVINVDGTLVNLSPGMNVTVEVKTGKRRVIDYVLAPLQRYQSESLREQ